MDITCKCGSLVVSGKYDMQEKKFIMDFDIQGEITKNHSNDPKDWTGTCSECQKKRDKKLRRKN